MQAQTSVDPWWAALTVWGVVNAVNLLQAAGFVDVTIGAPVDTFAGTTGKENARAFAVYGHAFLARKPG